MNALTAILRDEIARCGPMPFRRFMELALYHPEHGYYERGDSQIGKAGDYFTSVSVGPLFGELLAFRFAGWLETLGGNPGVLHFVEAGAHNGALAADILGWLERQRPALFERLEYRILEPSSRRQEWQQQRLERFATKVRWCRSLDVPDPWKLSDATASPSPALSGTLSPTEGERAGVRGAAPIHRASGDQGSASGGLFLNAAPARPLTGILFSNELLDAFPVHRLGWDAQRREWFEWAVTVMGDGFDWVRLPLGAGFRAAAFGSLYPALDGGDLQALEAVLPDGFSFEYSPEALAWWQSAATALHGGWLVAFDYGMTDGELLRPERPQGTLRAYAGHRASLDLLTHPGGQDLTAHVNFSALQAAGEAGGCRTAALVSQERFLMAIAAEILPAPAAFGGWREAQGRALRTLANPDHLGRSFRVLTQFKPVAGRL